MVKNGICFVLVFFFGGGGGAASQENPLFFDKCAPKKRIHVPNLENRPCLYLKKNTNLRAHNSRILRIKNAKISRCYF